MDQGWRRHQEEKVQEPETKKKQTATAQKLTDIGCCERVPASLRNGSAAMVGREYGRLSR